MTGALSASAWAGQGGGQCVERAGLGTLPQSRHLDEELTGGEGWPSVVLSSQGAPQWPGAEIKDRPHGGRGRGKRLVMSFQWAARASGSGRKGGWTRPVGLCKRLEVALKSPFGCRDKPRKRVVE